MNREAWVKLAFYAFLGAFVAGVYQMWGLPVTLMVGGALGAACALLYHDVDPPEKKGLK